MTSEFTNCDPFFVGVHNGQTIPFMDSSPTSFLKKVWREILSTAEGTISLNATILMLLKVRQKSPKGNHPVTPRIVAQSERCIVFSPPK